MFEILGRAGSLITDVFRYIDIRLKNIHTPATINKNTIYQSNTGLSMKLIDSITDKEKLKTILRGATLVEDENRVGSINASFIENTVGDESIISIFELSNTIGGSMICIGIPVTVSAISSSMIFMILPQQYFKCTPSGIPTFEWTTINKDNYLDYIELFIQSNNNTPQQFESNTDGESYIPKLNNVFAFAGDGVFPDSVQVNPWEVQVFNQLRWSDWGEWYGIGADDLETFMGGFNTNKTIALSVGFLALEKSTKFKNIYMYLMPNFNNKNQLPNFNIFYEIK